MGDISQKDADIAQMTTWAKELNAAVIERARVEAARDVAIQAIVESYEVILAPTNAIIEGRLADFTRHAVDNEREIKKRHGRESSFGGSRLKYHVGQKAVRTPSMAELTKSLQDEGLDDLLRWYAKASFTSIKEAPDSKPLRRALENSGTTVARHQTVLLFIPARSEPFQLAERMYPARPERPAHVD